MGDLRYFFRVILDFFIFEFSNFSVAFFWGIGLAFNAAGVFGRNAFWGQNWEEKKIQELMDKDKSEKWE